LFQEHIPKTGIGLIDADCVHKLLDVMVHGTPAALRGDGPGQARGCRSKCERRTTFHPRRPHALAMHRTITSQTRIIS
jgi:hypothetical protein